VKDVNVVKLKVKQLKLLEKSLSDLKKNNVEEGLCALGFKIGFYHMEYL